jgi:hypothetical protein
MPSGKMAGKEARLPATHNVRALAGNAIEVAQIATGETEEEYEGPPEENAAAVEWGRREAGGRARSRCLKNCLH